MLIYIFQNFGPSGEFYKLSLRCFKYDTTEYEYEICPFRSVKQQKFPRASVSLGTIPKWRRMEHGEAQLVMGGGDSTVCPGMVPRETLVSNNNNSNNNNNNNNNNGGWGRHCLSWHGSKRNSGK